jgi:arylsulfatase A-like enzyme
MAELRVAVRKRHRHGMAGRHDRRRKAVSHAVSGAECYTVSMNLLVIICHDLGRHVGCYGWRSVHTPHLDRLAAGGIRFSRAFCTAPQCSPSRAALWTGRYPHSTGVVGLTHREYANDLNPDERHLAALLHDAGYDTHLFGEQHMARSASRLGFDELHVQTHAMSSGPNAGTCGNVAHAFADWIAQRSATAPFFAQVAFFEPHYPFQPGGVAVANPADVDIPPYLPDISSLRHEIARYEASITNMDTAVGCVLDALQRSAFADDTLVVFTTDHGSPLPRAKTTLYDPGIATALLMRHPGMPTGRVVNALFSNVDLVPTLLELLDLPVPANLHGHSGAALVRGNVASIRSEIFAEKTYHGIYDPMRCIRTDRWKLIANFETGAWAHLDTEPQRLRLYVEVAETLRSTAYGQRHPTVELYDLERDPHENSNVADDPAHADIRIELTRRLRQWMQATADPLLHGAVAQGAYWTRMAAFMRT